MIDELIDCVVDGVMEFEELEPKDCKAVFVSGKNTLEIWKGDKLIHLRVFHNPYFAEFTFPEKELNKIIDKLKG